MDMNTSLVPVGSTAIPPSTAIHIAGLEHLDQREDMALPYLRVVQPTSTQAELMEGGEAKPGQFYDTALRVAHNDLVFAILAVQKFSVVWQEGKEPQLMYLILAADERLEPFVLKVSGTSVFSLKSLITSITRLGSPASWYYRVRAVTEKRESTKDGQPRKWFAIRFYIVEETSTEEREAMKALAGELSIGEALPPLEPDEIG
jgi:hypothetical protein